MILSKRRVERDNGRSTNAATCDIVKRSSPLPRSHCVISFASSVDLYTAIVFDPQAMHTKLVQHIRMGRRNIDNQSKSGEATRSLAAEEPFPALHILLRSLVCSVFAQSSTLRHSIKLEKEYRWLVGTAIISRLATSNLAPPGVVKRRDYPDKV
jgi:hypothetical protein